MRSVIAAITCTLAACTHASTTPVPRLAQGLETLRFYVGSWTCHATYYDERGAVSETGKLGVTVAPVLDGSWLAVAVLDKGVAVTSELKGYDPEKKRFRHLGAGEQGSAWNTISPGWVGDHLVFESDPPGDTRMTFTKIDDRHYRHVTEVTKDGKTYVKVFEKTCEKQ